MSLGNIGEIYHHTGQYEKALHYYQQSLDLFKEIGERRSEGISLNNIGQLSRELKRYKEALQCHQQALEICQEIEDRWGQWFSLEGIGDVYSELSQHAEALKYHEQARAISEEIGAKPQQLMCLSALGMDYLGLNEGEKALVVSTQAIQILEGGQTCQSPQEVYFNHFKVLSAHGRQAEALPYLQKAYDEVMRRAEKIKSDDQRRSFLENVKLNREIVQTYQQKADKPV